MGAYAGFPMVYEVFREALPGGAGRDFGVEIGQEQTAGGAKVTLEYAYADAGYVVVGYTVQDTEQDRTFGRFPSQLTPSRSTTPTARRSRRRRSSRPGWTSPTGAGGTSTWSRAA